MNNYWKIVFILSTSVTGNGGELLVVNFYINEICTSSGKIKLGGGDNAGVPHSRKRLPIPPVFCVILTFYGIPAVCFDAIKTYGSAELYTAWIWINHGISGELFAPDLKKKKKKLQEELGAFYVNVVPQHNSLGNEWKDEGESISNACTKRRQKIQCSSKSCE